MNETMASIFSPRVMIVVCALSAGWVGGFVAGDISSAPPSGGARPESAASRSPVPSASRRRVPQELAGFRDAVVNALLSPPSDQRTEAILDAFASLSLEDLPATLESILTLGGNERSELLPRLFARWAEFDPAAAAQRACELPEHFRDGDSLAAALEPWVATAPDAARAWAVALKNDAARGFAVETLAGILAEGDPEGALRFVEGIPSSSLTRGTLSDAASAIFRSWGLRDGPGAARRALSMAPGAGRRSAVFGAVGAWQDSDPRAALQWALGIQELGLQRAVVSNAAYALAARDPEGVTREILALPESPMRTAALFTCLRAISQGDVARSEELVAQFPPGIAAERARTALISLIAENDPAAAAARMSSQDLGSEYLTRMIAERWAATDIPAALDWATQIPVGDARENAVERVTTTWAEADPKAALAWVLAHPNAKDPFSRGNAIVGTWVENDPEVAVSWARSQPPGEGRNTYLARALDGYANTDPALAAEIAVRDLTGEAREEAAGSIAGSWAGSDPAAAAAWAEKLGAVEVRENALGSVARSWAESDSGEAAKWVQRLPVGSPRDSALAGLVETVSNRDPANAAKFVPGIGDADKRAEVAAEVFQKWSEKDRPAATQWLKTTPTVPAATKQALMDVAAQTDDRAK